MNMNLNARGKVVISLILFVIVCVAGYFMYQHLHPAQLVTGESQQQAETPQGISLAAHNAHVSLMQDQLDQAAQQIALLENKPPETIIKTVPYEIEKVVIKEVKKRGADFAIVTDPKQPDKVVDLKEVAKLPESTSVNLNQYNVFAYKEKLQQLDIDVDIVKVKINEVAYSESHKISKDGKYLGYVVGYDFDEKKIKTGIRITF